MNTITRRIKGSIVDKKRVNLSQMTFLKKMFITSFTLIHATTMVLITAFKYNAYGLILTENKRIYLSTAQSEGMSFLPTRQ